MTKPFRTPLLLLCLFAFALSAQPSSAQVHPPARKAASAWRTSTEPELRALLPARAPVVLERIETEARASSGIVNGAGRSIAGILLITAGYSAEGKYSYYLITQVPLRLGEIKLRAGQYVFGWVRRENELEISFYEAQTGKLLGTVDARPDPAIHRVESFRIWTPEEHSIMQIGRFTFAYKIEPE